MLLNILINMYNNMLNNRYVTSCNMLQVITISIEPLST